MAHTSGALGGLVLLATIALAVRQAPFGSAEAVAGNTTPAALPAPEPALRCFLHRGRWPGHLIFRQKHCRERIASVEQGARASSTSIAHDFDLSRSLNLRAHLQVESSLRAADHALAPVKRAAEPLLYSDDQTHESPPRVCGEVPPRAPASDCR